MSNLHPALWSRHGDSTDAVNDYRAMTTVPALVSDGIAVPPNLRALHGCVMFSHTAAGARSFTVVLYGYKSKAVITLAGVVTPIASSGGWAHIGEIDVSAAADANEGHLLEALASYTRVAARVTAPVGTPSVHVDFGFCDADDGED